MLDEFSTYLVILCSVRTTIIYANYLIQYNLFNLAYVKILAIWNSSMVIFNSAEESAANYYIFVV